MEFQIQLVNGVANPIDIVIKFGDQMLKNSLK